MEYEDSIAMVDDLEESVLDFIESLTYSNRELSLAKTNIEQGFMWLRNGIFKQVEVDEEDTE
jgi:hypothetical protein